MVEGGEGGDSSREGGASAAASGSARVPVPGTAEGEMSLQEISSEDVPFVPGEGSEFQKMAHQTSLSKFDLAPLPAPLKSMAFHLKLPYILAIVSTVFSVCAISLCVPSPFWELGSYRGFFVAAPLIPFSPLAFWRGPPNKGCYCPRYVICFSSPFPTPPHTPTLLSKPAEELPRTFTPFSTPMPPPRGFSSSPSRWSWA